MTIIYVIVIQWLLCGLLRIILYDYHWVAKLLEVGSELHLNLNKVLNLFVLKISEGATWFQSDDILRTNKLSSECLSLNLMRNGIIINWGASPPYLKGISLLQLFTVTIVLTLSPSPSPSLSLSLSLFLSPSLARSLLLFLSLSLSLSLSLFFLSFSLLLSPLSLALSLSKVFVITVVHSQLSSELTFENFFCSSVALSKGGTAFMSWSS